MKYFLILFSVFYLPTYSGKAQAVDTIPPYQKDSTLPLFSIQQTDSSWFNNMNLPKNEPTVIIYFSPECGHCQLTAHDYMKSIKRFKDVFFVWVSYQSMDEIRTFAEDYKMLNTKNIAVGRDPKYYIPAYFRVKYTPYIAAYDRNGRLLQTFDGGTDPDTLYKLINTGSN